MFRFYCKWEVEKGKISHKNDTRNAAKHEKKRDVTGASRNIKSIGQERGSWMSIDCMKCVLQRIFYVSMQYLLVRSASWSTPLVLDQPQRQ